MAGGKDGREWVRAAAIAPPSVPTPSSSVRRTPRLSVPRPVVRQRSVLRPQRRGLRSRLSGGSRPVCVNVSSPALIARSLPVCENVVRGLDVCRGSPPAKHTHVCTAPDHERSRPVTQALEGFGCSSCALGPPRDPVALTMPPFMSCKSRAHGETVSSFRLR